MERKTTDNDGYENHELPTPSFSATTIWIGGTSGLAQTYMEEFIRYPKQDDPEKTQLNRRFVLASPDALLIPSAPQTKDSYGRFITYLSLDMTKPDSIDDFFDSLMAEKTNLFGPSESNGTTTVTIIFGMRSALVKGSKDDHLSLADHLSYFLHQASRRFSSHRRITLAGILHVSSVAVMDHTVAQSMLNEDAPLPNPNSYSCPYDESKRRAEDTITSVCECLHIPSYVHLRISGILSNEIPPSGCIHMSSLRIQTRLGFYCQTPLDMNTSYNVGQAIRLILERMDDRRHQINNTSNYEAATNSIITQNDSAQSSGLHNVYFYTRPTIKPRRHGHNLVAYRSAHNINYYINIPSWFVLINIWAFIYLFRGIASAVSVFLDDEGKKRHKWLGVLENLTYLMTVSVMEHTFDNSRFRSDFPELRSLEESTLEGFVRIRKRKFQRNAAIDKSKY